MDPAAAAARIASPGDAAAVARLLADFNAEYDEPTPPPDVLAERLGRLLRTGRFWTVLAGEPPVAFATVAERDSPYYAGRAAYLEDLYVRPDLRGGGIGTRIMDALAAEARRRGIRLIEVGVDEPDVDALRFYVRHGFVHRDVTTGDRAFHLQRDVG